jgi:hypothetical protein
MLGFAEDGAMVVVELPFAAFFFMVGTLIGSGHASHLLEAGGRTSNVAPHLRRSLAEKSFNVWTDRSLLYTARVNRFAQRF